MFHPWRRLRELPRVELSWVTMPGRLGETNGLDRIRLHPHQSQVQRRCTLAHELAHIELGHIGGCSGPDEGRARALAARWLVSMDHLLAAARWSRSVVELADELWVDLDTLRTRLDGLSDPERAALRRAGADLDLP